MFSVIIPFKLTQTLSLTFLNFYIYIAPASLFWFTIFFRWYALLSMSRWPSLQKHLDIQDILITWRHPVQVPRPITWTASKPPATMCNVVWRTDFKWSRLLGWFIHYICFVMVLMVRIKIEKWNLEIVSSIIVVIIVIVIILTWFLF